MSRQEFISVYNSIGPAIPVGGGLEVRGERDVAAPASDGGGRQPEHGPEGVHEDSATDVDGAQDGQAHILVENEQAAGGAVFNAFPVAMGFSL